MNFVDYNSDNGGGGFGDGFSGNESVDENNDHVGSVEGGVENMDFSEGGYSDISSYSDAEEAGSEFDQRVVLDTTENAFKKEKIEISTNKDTGMTEILIQDESFTLMEPLVLNILQNDERLCFAGYKPTHCLNNEVLLRLKCVEGSGDDPKDCFKDALQSLLKELNSVEELCTI